MKIVIECEKQTFHWIHKYCERCIESLFHTDTGIREIVTEFEKIDLRIHKNVGKHITNTGIYTWHFSRITTAYKNPYLTVCYCIFPYLLCAWIRKYRHTDVPYLYSPYTGSYSKHIQSCIYPLYSEYGKTRYQNIPYPRKCYTMYLLKKATS